MGMLSLDESHYILCISFINYFLLIGNTSTGHLILNEEEQETTVDLNSQDTNEKTQKSDIPLVMIAG